MSLPFVITFLTTFLAKPTGSAKLFNPSPAACAAEPKTSPVILPPSTTSWAIIPTAGVKTTDTIVVTAANATTFAIFLAIELAPPPFAFSFSPTASKDLFNPLINTFRAFSFFFFFLYCKYHLCKRLQEIS